MVARKSKISSGVPKYNNVSTFVSISNTELKKWYKLIKKIPLV